MRCQQVSFADVELDRGFWHDRQEMNRTVTIRNVWKRFEETGRFAAFRFDWKEGMPNKPHYFFDSDVAKWMESAAFILRKHPDPWLEERVDELVDLIETHQQEDGYFNVWFTAIEPGERFRHRFAHELYCAGHLIEAAVAYADATGKERFLNAMCRYADCIAHTFMEEASPPFLTPGHEEIELALVKLYRRPVKSGIFACPSGFWTSGETTTGIRPVWETGNAPATPKAICRFGNSSPPRAMRYGPVTCTAVWRMWLSKPGTRAC